MVRVYAANVKGLPDPAEKPELMDGLPTERKEKILRYKQKADRIQCLCASLLLNEVLKKYSARMEDIVYGENGKPEIKGLHFNLSHSAEMAVCAVSGRKVGCDIEKIAEMRERVAERFFCESEVAYLHSLGKDKKAEEFYRLWTMKESYTKMTGEGLSFPMNRFEFLLGDMVYVVRDGKKSSCHIKEYTVPGYKLTVCAEEHLFTEEIEYVEI